MKINSWAIPFFLGGMLALLIFACFAWDLKYHWIFYSPASSQWRNWPSPRQRRFLTIAAWTPYLLVGLGRLWIEWSRRKRNLT
jgi:hypothetical protein